MPVIHKVEVIAINTMDDETLGALRVVLEYAEGMTDTASLPAEMEDLAEQTKKVRAWLEAKD